MAWAVEHDAKDIGRATCLWVLQNICETRNFEHDIFETFSKINIFEHHAKKKHPILTLLCSESDVSVFSLTGFSGIWSAQNIIMDEIGHYDTNDSRWWMN